MLKVIQFGLWFISVLGADSVWVENDPQLSAISVGYKSVGTARHIYNFPFILLPGNIMLQWETNVWQI